MQSSDLMGIGRVNDEMHCCGLREYDGLNLSDWSPIRMCLELMYAHEDEQFCVVVMTFARDNNSRADGWRKIKQLRQFVQRHKIGTVTLGKPVRNPNSMRTLFPAVLTIPDTYDFFNKIRDIHTYHRARLSSFERQRTPELVDWRLT